MTAEELRASTKQTTPPDNLPPLLTALWWDAKGDWNRAHEIAQDIHSPEAAWVHAYLHRKEGDEGNAGYWYRQARKPHAKVSMEDEWQQIVEDFLRFS